MNNTGLETRKNNSTQQSLKRNSSTSKKGLTISLFVTSLILWGGLVYGGYWLANQYINESKAYVDAKIEEVEKQNQEEMIELEAQLNGVYTELLNVKAELVFIEEDLALTGATLGGTDDTKVALQQRIDELNKQLKVLQTSIERLEDAAR